MDGYCSKCRGSKALVVGIVFLLNWFFQVVDWWLLVGLLLTLGGLLQMLKPSCGCEEGCCMVEDKGPVAKKKR